MHLSVELEKRNDGDPSVVEIYLDQEGLDLLLYKLEQLKKDMSEGEHVHLMAESWGVEDELSDDIKGANNSSIKHLKITSCQKSE